MWEGMENSSVYMCFPCYQEFNSLEEVLTHQLTCNPEGIGVEDSPTGNSVLQPEDQTVSPSQVQPCSPERNAKIGTEGQSPSPGTQNECIPDSTLQIQYQCGDCGFLFESLALWQRHRKLGECRGNEAEPSGDGADSGGTESAGEVKAVEESAGAEADVDTEQLQRERTVSQDHAYLQCDGVSKAGDQESVESELQEDAARGAAAAVTATVTQVTSVKEVTSVTQVTSVKEVTDPENSLPKRRGRKGKSSVADTSRQSFLCVDCGSSFSLVPELVAHRRARHGLEGALHRCSICGESFLNTTLFLYHRKQHSKREQRVLEEQEVVEERSVFPSEGPPESFVIADQSEMKEGGEGQMVLEAGTEAVQCASETAPAGSVNDGDGPEGRGPDVGKTAAEAPPAVPYPSFLCVDCGFSFSTEPMLVEHRRAQHDLEEALHRCPECGENFMNTTLFLYHRRQHREKREGTGEGTAAAKNPQAPKRPVYLLSTSIAHSGGASGPGHNPLPKRRRDGEEGDRVEIHKGGTDGADKTPTRGPQSDAGPLPKPGPDSLPTPAELSRDWSRTPLPHMCPHCGRTFTRRCLLRAHVFSHTGEKLFSCKVCAKAFSCPSNLMRHSRTHLGAKPFACERCGKTFTQSGTLKRHQFIHSKADSCSQLPHLCPDCPSSFKTRTQLQRHRLVHTGNPFVCSLCGHSFKRKKQLDLHSLVHQEKEPRSCPHCSAQFLSQSVLDIHLRRCSGEDDRTRGRGRGQGRGRSVGQMECDMCGHCCVTQEGLDLHRLSHTGQTPLRCPLTPCRRRFATSSALEKHVLAHCQRITGKSPNSTPRPFRCEHCGKGFAYNSTFRLHMRIHTGERPYECSHCGKRFRQIPHLQDHERIHSGERPFCCWVCGKSFSVAARLTEHARTHSGEKPYACTLCSRAFRSRSNLDKHCKIQHGSPKDPAGEGEAAVHAILLVQAPAAESAQPNPEPASSYPEAASSFVLLHPSVSVVDGQDLQHTIEFIIEETV